MQQAETIAAIATAPGEAGISIVRVSGPGAFPIADAILRCAHPTPSNRTARTFVHGFVHGPRESNPSADIDEVIALLYRAPQSYTGEDVVEFQGHGGRASAARILRAVLDAGATPAEPGEFTKRAFLNGRIDLLQAEAVADLIQARSDRAANAAVMQLEGSLSKEIGCLYDALLTTSADLAATLDFSSEDLPDATMAGLAEQGRTSLERLGELLDTWEEGHILRDGALVVISGEPNVGKSSLLNLLLGSDRAIVTDIPGTTRDSIEEQVSIDGYPVRLVDTAGLRETDCLVEQHGVTRAQRLVDRADLVIYVVDGSKPLSSTEAKHAANLDPTRTLVVCSKCDIAQHVAPSHFDVPAISACLLDGRDRRTIEAAILNSLGVQTAAPAHAVISERHRRLLQGAQKRLSEACALLDSEREDLVVPAADALAEAVETIGQIVGRTYTTDLLDAVFSRFCVGK